MADNRERAEREAREIVARFKAVDGDVHAAYDGLSASKCLFGDIRAAILAAELRAHNEAIEAAAKLGDDIIDVIKQVIEMHRENGNERGV